MGSKGTFVTDIAASGNARGSSSRGRGHRELRGRLADRDQAAQRGAGDGDRLRPALQAPTRSRRPGISSEAVKEEFAEHAHEEEEHVDLISPSASTSSAASRTSTPKGCSRGPRREYVEGENLVDMIKENLVAERIAIETYREMIRYFGDNDPTTRVLLERILAQEEEHANDMHDLLVAHEGRPMLKK